MRRPRGGSPRWAGRCARGAPAGCPMRPPPIRERLADPPDHDRVVQRARARARTAGASAPACSSSIGPPTVAPWVVMPPWSKSPPTRPVSWTAQTTTGTSGQSPRGRRARRPAERPSRRARAGRHVGRAPASGSPELPALDDRGGVRDVDRLEAHPRARPRCVGRARAGPPGTVGPPCAPTATSTGGRPRCAGESIEPAQSWWKISSAVMRRPVRVGDRRDDALERLAPARVDVGAVHPPEHRRQVRVVLAVVDDVGAAAEAGVVAEARRRGWPRIMSGHGSAWMRVVVGGALGVDDER